MEHNDNIPETLENFALEKNISSGMIYLLGCIEDRSQIITGPSNPEYRKEKILPNIVSLEEYMKH